VFRRLFVRLCLVSCFVLGSVNLAHSQQENGVTGLKLKPGKGRVLLVTGVLSGTPAEIVGLRKGDKIVAIADKGLKTMSLKAAVKRLKGAPGTKLHLTIKRGENEPFDIIIKRAKPSAKKKQDVGATATSSVATATAAATSSVAK